jgi:tripartite-type tricarboxylate transporter receptor subunit TctC
MRTALLVAAALALPAASLAQTYPTKPVRVISTIPLGGSGDVAIRLVTAKMSGTIGQTVLVETNGAAGGMVAARLVAQATPDGYTLFHSSNGALAAAPFTSKSPGYDPVKDFAPISLIAHSPSFIAVYSGVPVNSVQELVDYAKKNPGKLSYASNGVGSFFHLTGETFKMAAGVDILHVPYTGGNVSLSFNDLLAGRVDVFFPSLTLAGPQLSSGKIKLLAVLNEERLKKTPSVPTISEAFPAYTPMPSWFALVGPAKLPPAIVARLRDEVAKALGDAEVSGRLSDLGMSAVGSTPEGLAATIRKTMELTGKAVAALKIEPQ